MTHPVRDAGGSTGAGGGRRAVGLATAAFALLLGTHYLLKTAREPLVLGEVGPEGKAVATAAQALALLPALALYDALARRVSRPTLAATTFGVGAAALAGLAAAALAGLPVGLALHVWLGLFALLATAHLGSLATEVAGADADPSRALGRVGLGAAVGAIAGSAAAAWLVPRLAPAATLAAGGALLVAVLALAVAAERGAHARGAAAPRPAVAPASLDRRSAGELVRRDPYLRLLAAFTCLASCVGTLGEYVLDRALLAELAGASPATAAAVIARFKGHLYGVVNVVALALQLLLASRAIPLRAALALPALLCLGGWGAAAAVPAVAVVAGVKAADAALGHSLHATFRHALYLPTARDARHRAKAFIEVALARAGDLAAAGAVAAGSAAGLGTAHFAGLNAALSLGWLTAVALVAREHGRRARAAPAVEARARGSAPEHREEPAAPAALDAEERLAVA